MICDQIPGTHIANKAPVTYKLLEFAPSSANAGGTFASRNDKAVTLSVADCAERPVEDFPIAEQLACLFNEYKFNGCDMLLFLVADAECAIDTCRASILVLASARR